MEASLASSTIPQVDGVVEEDRVRYLLESTYHVDDVKEMLKEIFDANVEVNFTLESRVQTAPRSNRDLFVICLTEKHYVGLRCKKTRLW